MCLEKNFIQFTLDLEHGFPLMCDAAKSIISNLITNHVIQETPIKVAGFFGREFNAVPIKIEDRVFKVRINYEEFLRYDLMYSDIKFKGLDIVPGSRNTVRLVLVSTNDPMYRKNDFKNIVASITSIQDNKNTFKFSNEKDTSILYNIDIEKLIEFSSYDKTRIAIELNYRAKLTQTAFYGQNSPETYWARIYKNTNFPGNYTLEINTSDFRRLYGDKAYPSEYHPIIRLMNTDQFAFTIQLVPDQDNTCGNNGIENTPTDNTVLHRKILDEIHELYIRKNKAYGNSFHDSYDEEGFCMVRIRLSDKLNRFKTLSKDTSIDQNDESIRDTLIDLANYAIMTVMEIDNGKENS